MREIVTSRDESKFDVARTWHYRSVEFCAANYLRHRYSPHFHEQYSIGLVLRGALEFKHRTVRNTAVRGDVSIINPGEVHSGHAAVQNGWSIRNVLIASDTLAQCAGGKARDPVLFERPVNSDRRVFDAFLELHHATERSACEIAKESALIGAITVLISAFAQKQTRGQRVISHRIGISRACELMRDCFASALTLGELADAAHLSKHHFLRSFSADLGITPHAYLVQIRLRAALRFIKSGIAIAEAAASSGFADQSHLTRCFKRTLGVTPGAYADALASS